MIKLTDDELINIIYEIGNKNFSPEEYAFGEKFNKKYSNSWLKWSRWQFMVMGIYIGIKYMEKILNKE